jgi:hypothetical protein
MFLIRNRDTSTDTSENSFPELKTIMGRYFEYSIAFHGWDGMAIQLA